jgi:hypothetical protein
MIANRFCRGVCYCLLGCAAAFATPASAQVVGGANNGQNTGGIMLPGLNIPNQNLTPEQMQSIMMMRALQGRGRGQVRTGVPQGDPFAQQQPGFVPFGQGATPVDDSTATRKSSIEKRVAARKAQEEQKRAARDAAKAKKPKVENKAKQDKKAKPEKNVAAKKAKLEKPDQAAK